LTLEKFGITRTTIFRTIHSFNGGAQVEDEKRIRRLNPKDPSIVITKDKDCITLDDDMLGNRAKMSCGHSISAQTMHEYVKRVLRKNQYTHTINCPVPTCGKEWDLELVSKVADWSDQEYLNVQSIIDQRHCKNKAYKTCPSCRNKGQRAEDLAIFRARCTACKGPDFCWACDKIWKNSGLQICGNDGCPILDIQELLDKCETVEATGSKLQIPKIRACPKCLTFMEHLPGCKHILCKGCGWKFCFSCLKTESKKRE